MTDETDDSLNPLYIDPQIETPRGGAVVSTDGFYVEAWAPFPVVSNGWKLEFWGSSNPHYSTESPSPHFKMWIPGNAIKPGTFHFKIRYKHLGINSGWAESYNLTMTAPKPPRPVITNPGVVWTARPTISGTGVAGASVALFKSNTGMDGSIGMGSVQSNNRWTVTVTSPLEMADPIVLTASQNLNGEPSDRSNPVSCAVLFKPVITTITVAADGKPTISGTGGLKDATLNIYAQGGVGSIELLTTVRSDGTWSIATTVPWTVAKYTITAKQIGRQTGHSSDWADSKEVVVKPPKLVITQPTSPIESGQAIRGTGYYPGAKLTLIRGGVALPGTFTSDEALWTFTPNAMMPATWTITAEQTFGGATSNRSDPVTFNIVPYPPVITGPVQDSTIAQNQVINGNRTIYWETTLTMLEGSGTEVPGSFTKKADYTWSFTPSPGLPPGTRTFKVIQTVNGVPSAASAPRTFKVKPPKPAITPPPNPAAAKQVLTITGVYSGTVTLKMLTEAGTEVAGAFSTTGASRTFTPTQDWAPGSNKVKVVQTVGGVASDPSDLVTLTVKPPKPVITGPTTPTPPRPTFSGTGHDGATVNVVQQSHSTPILATATVRSGTWSAALNASIPNLPAGPYPLSARQLVGGVPSDWTPTFEINVKPPKPSITRPPNPADEKEVLTITDVWSGTVGLYMFSEANVNIVGNFSPEGTTRTFTRTAKWPPGTNKVKVLQIVGGVASDPSDLVTLTVKPPKPAITPPPNPAAAKQVLTITGVYSGTVTLKMFNEAGTEVAGAFSTTGASRTFTPTQDWAPGSNKVKVVQTVGGVASDPSDLVTLTVKPPKPAITPPPNPAAAKQVLTITGVYSGTVTLKMFNEAGTEVAGAFSTTGTTRTFTPTADWPLGTKVKVVQTVGGVASDPSDLSEVAVKPPIPAITGPTPPTSPRPTFSGTGHDGATVNVVQQSHSTPILATATVSNGIWSAALNAGISDLPAGPYPLSARQLVGGVPSDWTPTFEIKVKPPTPKIARPPNPATMRQALTVTNVYSGIVTPTLRNGFGNPIDGDFDGTGTSRTFTPSQDWGLGDNTVGAVQTVNSVESDRSDALTFKVVPPNPEITQPPSPAATRQALTVTNVYPGIVTLKLLTAEGRPVGGDFDGTGTSRTFTPSQGWDSGENTVRVVQTAGRDSQQSDPITFKARPPTPAIAPPPNPAAARQELSVTEVYSGIVTLKLLTAEGRPVGGDFDGTGTSRTFTPSQEWDSGENTVKAIQAVNGVDSDPSDECTFTVAVEEKPETPYFVLPETGFQTPTRPTIRVIGLPSALMTVRLEGSETLHSDTANAEGVLEFVAATPLVPGPNALQVKQQQAGPESDWSEPHAFTVKELPKVPVINAPTQGSSPSTRHIMIRGEGESRGQIRLRHKDAPENLIGIVEGSSSWRWTAKEPWDLGTYTIEVQQTDDGDSSSWTEPRTFTIVEARYGIGDAGPVLAQPVVSNHESVLLRVQVVSGETGAAVEGVEVEWRIVGEQAVKAITVTDPLGWARYLYTPDTAGEHTVVADLTHENQGVEITQRFEVTALTDDAWAQEFELYLEGEKVDLAKGDLALLRGKAYELELKVKNGSLLIGSSVTLQDLSEAEALGLRFVPPLGAPQPLEEGQSVRWSITSDTGKSGYFGLKLTSPRLPDWQLPGRVIAQDLSEDVDVHFDTFARVFGGAPAYPCIGATHTLTVRPKAQSLLLGKKVILEITEDAASLGVVVSPEPNIPQTLGADGVGWTFNCVNSTKSGSFSVRLRVLEWDLSSLALPMLLGNNKVKVVDSDGPREIGGTGERWRTGVCVASAFTEKVVEVPVTVRITGKEPSLGETDSRGWIYIHHGADESVIFTFHNLYDGSTA
ncbi:hypothetical protein [Pseudomonas purpurea]|uniref:hypothetical protein n=1 Tax=Pseudomonas purpurea TaxID=3136737 RepID=UPI003264D2B4